MFGKQYKIHFDHKSKCYTVQKRIGFFKYVWAEYKYFPEKERVENIVKFLNNRSKLECLASTLSCFIRKVLRWPKKVNFKLKY
jgi:hypothetical protein